MNGILLWVIEFLSLAVVTFFSTKMMSREMKKRDFRFPRLLLYAVTEGGLVVLFLLGGFTAWTLRGCALIHLLLFASIEDRTYHEADDALSVMILLLALSTVTEATIFYQLLGALVVFVAQMFGNVFKKKMGIGGGDIKITLPSVFLLGFYRGTIGFMFGLLLAIIVELIRNSKNKQPLTKPFPLVPYLSVGYIIGYLL